uniref:Uncharacterized protein n=1 Tax=Oryza glumipatula TaxID=40148 RepID=A0A0D9ZWZ5_9ORYZ
MAAKDMKGNFLIIRWRSENDFENVQKGQNFAKWRETVFWKWLNVHFLGMDRCSGAQGSMHPEGRARGAPSAAAALPSSTSSPLLLVVVGAVSMGSLSSTKSRRKREGRRRDGGRARGIVVAAIFFLLFS